MKKFLLIPSQGGKREGKSNHSYLAVQCILALLHALGHLVVQVPQVNHLDLAGHRTLLHLFFLDKCKICTSYACI